MPRYSKKWTEINVLTRDQFSFQTWLFTGALLQTLLLHYFPPKYALFPTVTYALYTTTTYLLESLSILSSSTQPPSPIGRFTAHPPPDRPVTVFLLGFQSSHPLRIMAWGTKTIGDHFNEMFAEAEGNPDSGLLGRCGPLLDTSKEGGNAMFTISYWRSKDELMAFNKGVAHSKGMKWYYATKAKYPYLGLMHEVYECPAGNFENVYINFREFGLRTTKWDIDGERKNIEVRGGPKATRDGDHKDARDGDKR